MKKFNEVGICAKCGSDEISYDETRLDGENMGYIYFCDKCNHQGMEWYHLEWVEQE